MSGSGTPATARGPEEIRAEIEATRADLAEAMSALSAKLDVKSRTKHTVLDTTSKVRTTPAFAAGALAATGLAAGVIQRRRGRSH
jgi:ElaB/YqjD/DUF883 family membrane-anchored ribosome-binding protein